MSFKKSSLIAALALSVFSGAVSAQWSVSGGYTYVSSDNDGIDVSLSALTAGVAYTFYSESKTWSVMPELKAGFGVGDDSVEVFSTDLDVELSRYLSAAVRGNYHVSDTITVYVQPAYTNLELEAKAFGNSAKADEWEFGVGAGLNAQISENFSIEGQYERFSDADILSVNLRYAF